MRTSSLPKEKESTPPSIQNVQDFQISGGAPRQKNCHTMPKPLPKNDSQTQIYRQTQATLSESPWTTTIQPIIQRIQRKVGRKSSTIGTHISRTQIDQININTN